MTTKDPRVLLDRQADASPSTQLERAEPLRVPFAGLRGVDGPLTLGQASTLEWITNPAFYTRMLDSPLTTAPAETQFSALAAQPIEETLLFLLRQVTGELILSGLTRDASLLPAGET
ncbi:MAG TPA: hypothetical protein VHZ03_05655 [Trebonia sp.]|jgi:hypothetical protein|nr:hypothetical protein [Trebonia sp.]